jgi:formylglycine-generating enzyme required for sulfatase activity
VEGSNEASAQPEPQGVSDEQKAALVGRILRGELTPQEACESEGLSELELKRWVRAYTRAARRAMDDQLAAALAEHGLELDERPTTEFSGDLGSVGLPELMQTIHFGNKDAHIRIDHDGEQSWLWCLDGDVVDAASARLTGSAAVYRILSIQRGQLHAGFSAVQRPRTIHASTLALMLEAAKRADECAEIRGRLGDTRQIYVPSASAPSDESIEPDRATVLRAFDGERSIDDVVHQSELPDLETLGLIEHLIEQQWLVLESFGSVASSARAEPRAVASSIVDASFRPLAASLRARFSQYESRHRLWASAFAGVAVVAGAFAVGFYSAQREATSAATVAPPAPMCGAQLAALPGGVCIDRAEVSAGDYQVCVRSGACESVQREFEPAAVGAPPAGAAGAAPGTGAGSPSVSAGAATGSTVPASVTSALPATPNPGAAAPASPALSDANASGNERVEAVAPAAAGLAAGAPSAASATSDDDASAHCNAGLPGRERFAVNCVTFQQARRYCEWRGGRLPLRGEWELAASPEQANLGVADLIGGVSEWTLEPATGTSEAAHERAVVLGGGLASGSGSGTAGTVTRLYMNANAQGRSVGFRCVVRADAAAPATAANREPSPS